MLSKSFLKERRDLTLEIRLATESQILSSVLDQIERGFSITVSGESQAVLDDHLSDKIVLCVFDHSEGHNVKESVAFSIWHHRVSASRPYELFKDISVKLGGGDVNRRFASDISHKGTGLFSIQKGVDHEGVTAEDGLVQSQLAARVNLGSLLLHDHVENAEVKVAGVLKKLNDKVLLVQ